MCLPYHINRERDGRRLPGTMTTGRMLLHLYDNPLPEDIGSPQSVTQAGISAAVHIQRKHVPRTLTIRKPVGIDNRTATHPGAKQRRRVYGLTSTERKGLRITQSILWPG